MLHPPKRTSFGSTLPQLQQIYYMFSLKVTLIVFYYGQAIYCLDSCPRQPTNQRCPFYCSALCWPTTATIHQDDDFASGLSSSAVAVLGQYDDRCVAAVKLPIRSKRKLPSDTKPSVIHLWSFSCSFAVTGHWMLLLGSGSVSATNGLYRDVVD